ncbi:uncharacterized protein LOC126838934 isoform X6 [Adelges cooleyi]|uniref:uncharacterized protein LOC126838933 isoform X2 n=1 Tax=Adelges cooleyi TaxID=133065 RepID=UPI00217FA873|nr:uncharacterized protein LOC126838933 isoform X2 [Adelges cooleyi]XP_050429692.1 uncharacterized protein LOC126838934 isoform X5 [Adelges cooleyi]XP_050429693.1 uncharacterized protein LOC126838934 isoform X6 [Adelges cooleyi]
MVTIKMILLLSLATYVACGGGSSTIKNCIGGGSSRSNTPNTTDEQNNDMGNTSCVNFNRGNREETVYDIDGNTVKFKGNKLFINGIKAKGVKAKNVSVIEIGEGSLKINGIINEQFAETTGEGLMHFYNKK